ncbi:DNA modification methylase [Hymenobacter psychrotolerans]|uniref:Methyltransferase n=1 Tax=Hymenobacter psychrotolerans DSM 18569 TaxID=1121959 RepID=A0A1M7E793_9BACT|nr:DNA modification methylase [Hymenobacter psychrotolerans]SHL87593.1 DNA modification methylase [Hymenobacter psychrotolerans DSM 18569]
MTEELIPLEWHNATRRVRDLVPLEYNPRIATEDGLKRLNYSLSKFGLVEVPVLNSDNVVLAGHQRLRILLDLGRGEELIDVRMPNRQLTKDELDEYNLISNTDAAVWDYEGLLRDFSHLEMGNIFGEDVLGQLAALTALQLPPAEEQAFDPAPPATPISVLGDVYEFHSIGRGLVHRLVCGSSTEADVMETLLQGELIQLTNTDPPYNVKYEGKTKDALTIQNDDMGDAEFRAFLYDFYTNVYAYSAPGAPIYVFHADSEGANFRLALKEAGLKLSQCLVWVKQSFVMGRQDFHWQHEPILYGWKEGAAHPWYSDRKQTTVLNFDRPSRNADHPTMKPLEILEYLIECSSQQDDIVFDGFGGSGSLLIACEKTQRSARSIELDPAYVDVHVRRFVQFMRDNQHRFSVTRNGQELTEAQLQEYVDAAAA